MITAFGYDKKNGDGISSTLERLANATRLAKG